MMNQNESETFNIYSRDPKTATHVEKTYENPCKVLVKNQRSLTLAARRGRKRKPSPKLYAIVRSGVQNQSALQSADVGEKTPGDLETSISNKSSRPQDVSISPLVIGEKTPDLINELRIPNIEDGMQTPNRAGDMGNVEVMKGPEILDIISCPRQLSLNKRRRYGKSRKLPVHFKAPLPKTKSLLNEEPEEQLDYGQIEVISRRYEPPEDGIKMIIASRHHPCNIIIKPQFYWIEKKLIELIDETALQPPSPRFHSTEYVSSGVIELTCANTETKTWLQEQIPEIGNFELMLVTPEEFAKLYIVVQVSIHDTGVDEHTIVTRLASQNLDVALDKWEVLSVKKSHVGRQIMFRLDKESYEHLEKLRFQLHYGLGMVTLKPLPRVRKLFSEIC